MAHTNVWEPGKPYSDGVSHFNRFTKASIQKFFGVQHGAWKANESAPNWVQPIADEEGTEYQLIRLDDDGNLLKEYPFYLRITPKANVETMAAPDPGKGKGVASWDYRAVMDGMEMWSRDPVKHIICTTEGLTYAIGSRMPASGRVSFATHNQLHIGTEGGALAVVPFVVLAFYMWLETEEATSVNAYLKKIGWANEAG